MVFYFLIILVVKDLHIMHLVWMLRIKVFKKFSFIINN